MKIFARKNSNIKARFDFPRRAAFNGKNFCAELLDDTTAVLYSSEDVK